MTGRYTLTLTAEQLVGAFPEFTIPEEARSLLAPRYNIPPGVNVPMIPNDGGMTLAFYRWGLIPHWADNPKKFTRTMNARAETAAELASFRTPFRTRRCLLLADSYYLWVDVLGKDGSVTHLPFRVMFRTAEPFCFAGLWDEWESPGGERIRSVNILTTDANELLQKLNRDLRMPAILPREDYEAWLDPRPKVPEAVSPLLRPHPAEGMIFYPLSDLVNNVANDNPAVIEPLPREDLPR